MKNAPTGPSGRTDTALERADIRDELLTIIHPYDLTEAEMIRQQGLRERIMKALGTAVRELEKYALSTAECELLKTAPMRRERIERVLTWLDRLSEEKAGIPEEADENAALSHVGTIRLAMEALVAMRSGQPLTQDGYDRFECPEFYDEVMTLMKEITRLAPIEDLYTWQAPLALCGIGSKDAMGLRELWLKKGVPRELVLKSLAGVDTPEADQLRVRIRDEALREPGTNPRALGDWLLQSLIGIDTEEAMKWRIEIWKTMDLATNVLVLSLTGLCSDAAMRGREWCSEQSHAGYIEKLSRNVYLVSLSGVETTEALEWRKQNRHVVSSTNLLEGLGWLSSDAAMDIREQAVRQSRGRAVYEEQMALEIARSLYGVGTSRSMELRERLMQDGVSQDVLMHSLSGVDTPDAWKMRYKLTAASNLAVLMSMRGLASDEAMTMRRKCYEALVSVAEQDDDWNHAWDLLAKSLVGAYRPDPCGLRTPGGSPEVLIESLRDTNAFRQLRYLRRATEEAFKTESKPL